SAQTPIWSFTTPISAAGSAPKPITWRPITTPSKAGILRAVRRSSPSAAKSWPRTASSSARWAAAGSSSASHGFDYQDSRNPSALRAELALRLHPVAGRVPRLPLGRTGEVDLIGPLADRVVRGLDLESVGRAPVVLGHRRRAGLHAAGPRAKRAGLARTKRL